MARLSVCMIARDEEQNIARALASVQEVADEVILTDTGSTDRTSAIARDLGAQVASFPWGDDFSAARNQSLARATGDWVLWLDADEELLSESLPELRRCLTEPAADAYYLSRRDLIDLQHPDVFTEMWQLRLFRRLPGLQYLGRCHPHFDPASHPRALALEAGAATTHIQLRHTGYLTEKTAAKRRRGIHLLELELRDRPGQFYYQVELARAYLDEGDPRGLTHLAEAARPVTTMKKPRELGAPIRILLEMVLTLPNLPGDFPMPRRLAYNLAREHFPDCPPLLVAMAYLDHREGRLTDAARKFEQVLALGQSGAYDRTTGFHPAVFGPDTLLNLAYCYQSLRRHDDARRCFAELLRRGVRVEEARRGLATIASSTSKPRD